MVLVLEGFLRECFVVTLSWGAFVEVAVWFHILSYPFTSFLTISWGVSVEVAEWFHILSYRFLSFVTISWGVSVEVAEWFHILSYPFISFLDGLLEGLVEELPGEGL